MMRNKKAQTDVALKTVAYLIIGVLILVFILELYFTLLSMFQSSPHLDTKYCVEGMAKFVKEMNQQEGYNWGPKLFYCTLGPGDVIIAGRFSNIAGCNAQSLCIFRPPSEKVLFRKRMPDVGEIITNSEADYKLTDDGTFFSSGISNYESLDNGLYIIKPVKFELYYEPPNNNDTEPHSILYIDQLPYEDYIPSESTEVLQTYPTESTKEAKDDSQKEETDIKLDPDTGLPLPGAYDEDAKAAY